MAERQMDISLADFVDILFDKDKQKQFLEECKELGIIDDAESGE